MRNRVTRLRLSSSGAGNQPQAQTGEIAQEANAFGKADGYADVGAENRKVKVLAEVRSYTTRDKSLFSEEPDEGKLSRPVREWRRGGQPPRRP